MVVTVNQGQGLAHALVVVLEAVIEVDPTPRMIATIVPDDDTEREAVAPTLGRTVAAGVDRILVTLALGLILTPDHTAALHLAVEAGVNTGLHPGPATRLPLVTVLGHALVHLSTLALLNTIRQEH